MKEVKILKKFEMQKNAVVLQSSLTFKYEFKY